jgi:hypothetical protein
MWIGGDAIMLGFMMLVFLMWAHADRVGTASRGWLEAVRTASFESLVAPSAPARAASGPEPPPDLAAAAHAPQAAAVSSGATASPGATASSGGTAGPDAEAAPEPAVAGARGTIDDDEHLAAYNAYLARLNQPGHRPGR